MALRLGRAAAAALAAGLCVALLCVFGVGPVPSVTHAAVSSLTVAGAPPRLMPPIDGPRAHRLAPADPSATRSLVAPLPRWAPPPPAPGAWARVPLAGGLLAMAVAVIALLGARAGHRGHPAAGALVVLAAQTGYRDRPSRGSPKRTGGTSNVLAKNERVKRLNSLLKRALSSIILAEVRDPRVSPHVTVTEVDITNDLSHCKVWVSVHGSDRTRQDTIAALVGAASVIRYHVAKEVQLRRHPVLHFRLDDSVDRAARMEEVLGQLNGAGVSLSMAGHQDWDDDEDDGDYEGDGISVD